MNNLWQFISPFATPAEGQIAEGIDRGGPGSQAVDAYWNCVYACVCVMIKLYTGIDVEPEQLRNWIHPGPHHTGGENFVAVKGWLDANRARFPGLPRLEAYTKRDVLGEFQALLNQNFGVIYDVWDDRNANVLAAPKPGWGGSHAVILEAMGPHIVTLWNPWRGEQEGQNYTRQYMVGATSGDVGNLLVFAAPVPGSVPAPAPIPAPAPAPVPKPPAPLIPPVISSVPRPPTVPPVVAPPVDISQPVTPVGPPKPVPVVPPPVSELPVDKPLPVPVPCPGTGQRPTDLFSWLVDVLRRLFGLR